MAPEADSLFERARRARLEAHQVRLEVRQARVRRHHDPALVVLPAVDRERDGTSDILSALGLGARGDATRG